jgi:iron(III) transport system substrate-binding protein
MQRAQSLAVFLATLGLMFAAGLPESRAAAANAIPATENALVVYATFHSSEAAELFAAFARLHPGVHVHYELISTGPLFRRFVEENQRNQPSADVVWSPAMNLQMKLINDGYAQPVESSQTPYSSRRAIWNGMAYVITTEPVVFIYNRRLLSQAQVPHSHTELARWLATPGPYEGKVVAYDPLATETGMLLFSQDLQVTRDTWDITRGLARNEARFYAVAAEMIRAVGRGEAVFGYNTLGASALEIRKQIPDIGVVVPSDYVLVMSRTALVSRKAPHPAAARVFLDFLLSRDAQSLMASHGMSPVRTDLAGAGIQLYLDPKHTQTIPMGLTLLSDLDGLVRARFQRDWRRAIETR